MLDYFEEDLANVGLPEAWLEFYSNDVTQIENKCVKRESNQIEKSESNPVKNRESNKFRNNDLNQVGNNESRGTANPNDGACVG